MDRGRALARVLIAAAVPAGFGAAATILPLTEARWLAPARLADDLTSEPSECLSLPPGLAQRRAIAIGRAAFRAPLLLGGQAARAGLSCASCHRNGRGNPHFRFPGLSGADGTADVTASLMSSHRGDGTFNPKPIPDLAAPRQDLKVSRDPADAALARFIRGLVVEEFDGAEPPPSVLAGLAAYVRAVKPEACGKAVPITLDRSLAEVDAALAAAVTSDDATAALLIGAARSTLGRIDERYRLPGLEGERALLAQADAELRLIRQAASAPAISSWRARWDQGFEPLRRSEARSLYAPDVLRARLKS